jgi:hypothetical protein
MQAVFDRWALRRSGGVPPELIARVAPAGTGGLSMRSEIRNFCGKQRLIPIDALQNQDSRILAISYRMSVYLAAFLRVPEISRRCIRSTAKQAVDRHNRFR